jgi:signal transduction histidine kinase
LEGVSIVLGQEQLGMVGIFFLYGLAFFSMGLILLVEGGRGSDRRLKHALRPLAAFGFIHGFHEWMEMFLLLDLFYIPDEFIPIVEAIRILALAFSFLSLAVFGAFLFASTKQLHRLSLMIPLAGVALWGFGLLYLKGIYSPMRIWDVADVWTRYVLGIPAGLFACAGLIVQQRAFLRAGMASFGRDSLWAGITFVWYAVIGQIFTRPSPLPPSTFLNENLFLYWFGFPVQVMRMLAAGLIALFVFRFLRSFEYEKQREISLLQEQQLRDAQEREVLRGQLFERVMAAQEAERQRIARELHDETGQGLTALGMGIRAVSKKIDPSKNPRAAKNIVKLEKLVSHTLDELQRLISDLRPSHLDDLGLPAALRWYSGAVHERTNLPIQVNVTGDEHRLNDRVKLALFRIVQEALNNVTKHANAQTAIICLSYLPGAVQLQIHDDGQGFDYDFLKARGEPTWGLAGIQERATILGGECQIYSAKGEGTIIKVELPEQRDGFFQSDSNLEDLRTHEE